LYENREDNLASNLRVRVRFDFKGTMKSGRFFFGGKPSEKIAVENRLQKADYWRNIPVQGICIDDVNIDLPLYSVYDETQDNVVAYAPMEITLSADSIEDIVGFIMREEFRKIAILAPEHLCVSKFDAERLFFRMNETMRTVAGELKRKAK
jgi:hypothetical protein